MTSSIAEETDRRRRRGKVEPLFGVTHLRAGLLEQLEEDTRIRLPSKRYQRDPVAFFREILGVEPWDRQVAVLEAMRDNPRGAVKSGHKVSKSHTIAGASLWVYSSWEDARVVLTSTTARQVDHILWRELRMMRARGGRCIDCKLRDPEGRTIPRPCPHSTVIEGDCGELARTGLKSIDFREITGFTAREAEAVAGVSGANLWYFPDEASGIDDAIFEAIEGNRAGGARLWMFGNPTRTSGKFFDAFNGEKKSYSTHTISSEETPNVREKRVVIPGLATYEWIEEKKLEWGEESALYKIRVKGEFATKEDGKIFSVHAIAQAEQRWEETPADGRLYVGVDPAGESGMGDETVFAIRRGLKLLELVPHRGLNDDAHVVHLVLLMNRFRNATAREVPVVVLDREGSVGSKVYGLLRAYAEQHPGSCEVVGLRASDRAIRTPAVYDRIRDELAANLEAWFRDGGAIPEDSKLAAELHFLEWRQAVNGRLKVTAKDAIRKDPAHGGLGRSPDRYDALALSTWEPLHLQAGVSASAQPIVSQELGNTSTPTMDPYAGSSAWRPKR